MEEILASIRRIISEDNEPEGKPEALPEPVAVSSVPPPSEMDDDVLELTQMVRDDGSVVDVNDWNPPPEAEPEPEPEPDFGMGPQAGAEAEPEGRHEPEMAQRIDVDDHFASGSKSTDLPDDEEDLVSAPTAAAASAAFAQLADSLGGRTTSVHAGGPTIEGIVREMLRPLLREWLDQNLPPIVERMVQREIEKMVRRSQGG